MKDIGLILSFICIIIQSIRCETVTESYQLIVNPMHGEDYEDPNKISTYKNTEPTESTPFFQKFDDSLLAIPSSIPQTTEPNIDPFDTNPDLLDAEVDEKVIDLTKGALLAATEPAILAATELIMFGKYSTNVKATNLPETTTQKPPTMGTIEPKSETIFNTIQSVLSPAKFDEFKGKSTTQQMKATTEENEDIRPTTVMPIYNELEDTPFVKLGIYNGINNTTEYQKTYFMPRVFRGDWLTAKLTCKTFDKELATFESLDEFTKFQQLWEDYKYSKYFEAPFYLHVDGFTKTPKSTDEWYFTKNGKKISFEMPWLNEEPNFGQRMEYCLSVGKKSSDELLKFNDSICYNSRKNYHFNSFVCQKIEVLN